MWRLPARRFKRRTSSALKTAAMATASRATVTTTPPTEVTRLVSSGRRNFPQLRSNARAPTQPLICVFVITERTMQICRCGSVTSNFLHLENVRRPHAPVLLAGVESPPKAPIPISHLGEREKTLGRTPPPQPYLSARCHSQQRRKDSDWRGGRGASVARNKNVCSVEGKAREAKAT